MLPIPLPVQVTNIGQIFSMGTCVDTATGAARGAGANVMVRFTSTSNATASVQVMVSAGHTNGINTHSVITLLYR